MLLIRLTERVWTDNSDLSSFSAVRYSFNTAPDAPTAPCESEVP
jgi:hypothetical protein